MGLFPNTYPVRRQPDQALFLGLRGDLTLALPLMSSIIGLITGDGLSASSQASFCKARKTRTKVVRDAPCPVSRLAKALMLTPARWARSARLMPPSNSRRLARTCSPSTTNHSSVFCDCCIVYAPPDKDMAAKHLKITTA